MNGDGFAEVTVGAPGPSNQFGRVAVFDGLDLRDHVSEGVACIFGREGGDGFGVISQSAGDMNGDGYPDLAVLNRVREAHLIGGGLGFRADELTDCGVPDPTAGDAVLELDASTDFMDALAASGIDDVTGDGINDLLVTSGDDNTTSGVVEVFAGGTGWEEISRSPVFTIRSSPELHTAAGVDLYRTTVPSIAVPYLGASGPTVSIFTVDGF